MELNKITIKDKDGKTELLDAAWKGQIDMCRSLIEEGADVNSKDIDGWTPFMFAVFLPPKSYGRGGNP